MFFNRLNGKSYLISCVFFCCLYIGSCFAESSKNGQIPLDKNIFFDAMRAFTKEIDSTYPFFELKRIKRFWLRCKKDLLIKSKTCTTNDEFYVLLDQARRCLRDSHMSFSNLKGQYPSPPESFYPGISFLAAVKKQVVIMSASDEYAQQLKPGTIVKLIDSQDARTYLDNQARDLWKQGGYFSSPQRARLYTYRIPFKGPKDQTHELKIVTEIAEPNITVTNKYPAGGWPHTYAMPENLKQRGHCRYGKLDSGFGYIYLRRMRSELPVELDEAFNYLQGTPGLIFDLRGNGGGGYNHDIFKRFEQESYPVVTLIDAGTFSAGETFARDLMYKADAYVMGSRSAGSSTAKRTWKLPHDLGDVLFSTRSRHGPNGKPIEYNGIRPNKRVEVVPKELRQGLNSGILRAEEYLKRTIKSSSRLNKRQ